MDFALSEEQKMIKSMVRDFSEKELRPIARQLDEEERFPEEIVAKLGGLGIMGIIVPPEYGGSGADAVSYMIAVEELSRVCPSTGIIVSVNNSLVCDPVKRFGTDEQKHRFLPRLSDGKGLGAFALTEPNAGSDVVNLGTTCRKEGDGYTLNGSKIFITNGSRASHVLVFATLDKSLGHKGMCALVVEDGTKGFVKGKKEKKMGIRASDTAQLTFENCHVPASNLLGKEGEGFKIAMATLDSGRISVGAQAVGIAQGAFEESLRYSTERQQFGGPISELQAIQFMLSDMATEIEAARLLVYRAAAAKDAGLPFSTESAMAKLYASDVAVRTTRNAVQVHGGYGYMREYDVERFYRDAKITEIYEGTSEVQRLVISRALLK